MLLVDNRADAAVVSPASDHAQVSDAELDEVLDLASLDVQHHGIILLRHIQKSVGRGPKSRSTTAATTIASVGQIGHRQVWLIRIPRLSST